MTCTWLCTSLIFNGPRSWNSAPYIEQQSGNKSHNYEFSLLYMGNLSHDLNDFPLLSWKFVTKLNTHSSQKFLPGRGERWQAFLDFLGLRPLANWNLATWTSSEGRKIASIDSPPGMCYTENVSKDTGLEGVTSRCIVACSDIGTVKCGVRNLNLITSSYSY